MDNNILVIGNGYDIAHGLKTKYGDFIEFIRQIKKDDSSIKNHPEYNEICECIEHNGYVQYFMEYANNVKSWVDLEKLLSEVNGYFEEFIYNYAIYGDVKGVVSFSMHDMSPEMFRTVNCIDMFKLFDCESYNFTKARLLHKKYYTYQFGLNKREILMFLKEQLDELIKLLRIYLINQIKGDTVINKITQIEMINPSYVISFNYTDTYKIYGIKSDDVFHVHGSLDTNNMVLGYNDDEPDKLDFVYFKKYFQRIQKMTGYIDKDRICYYSEGLCECSVVHFYGHSMDKTDRDIIEHLHSLAKEFVIYYYDQEDYEQKVINLIDIFGKKHAMEMIQTRWIKFIECES